MKLKNKINFSNLLQPCMQYLGFTAVPVKMGYDNEEPVALTCEPAEAQAWTIKARLPSGDYEYIADVETEKEAIEFIGFLDRIIEGFHANPDEARITISINDVIVVAQQEKKELTNEQARKILHKVVRNGNTFVWIDQNTIADAIRQEVG